MNDNNTFDKTETLRAEVAEELNQVFENILPWTLAIDDQGQMLKQFSEDDPETILQFLKSIYLFKITEVSVADDRLEDAVCRTLVKRHQALVTAAYQSSLTITTVIFGQGSGVVSLYLGVSGEDGAKDIFKHQLQGIYPGKGIDLQHETGDDGVLQRALSDKTFGGIVTGIPPVRIENERQSFDLTSVIRSMYGQPFLLMTVARPVPKEKAAQQIMEIMRIKDTCHSLVKRTVTQSKTGEIHEDAGSSLAENNGGGNTNIAKGGNVSGAGTGGINLSGAVAVMVGGGVGIPGIGWGMSSVTFSGTIGGTLSGTLTLGGAISKTQGYGTTPSDTTTESKSSGWSRSIGQSLQLEQQNSLAMELEQIADKLIKRLRIGLNSGVWEVFLTYATDSDLSSKILSGALCGELLKADPDALPSKNLKHALPNKGAIYLPKSIGSGNLTANPLISHLSSEEAAMLLSPPLSSVPGFDVRVKPALCVTDFRTSSSEKPLGAISEHGRQIEGASFYVSANDIRKHVFVAGLTGSGKTTTVKQLLASMDVPFLVLESAKREYRRLLANEQFKEKVRIFTVGDSNLAPFRHNPFHVLPRVSALTHIDHLKSIFNASFSLYGPMPYLLEQCLHNIFRKKGWNLTTGKHHSVRIDSFEDCRNHYYIYPTIRDLITEVNLVVAATGYAEELRDNIRSAIIARMESLAVGAKGFIFNTHECMDIGRLLKQHVVFELESLADDDDKAFFVGLILSLISEHRQTSGKYEESLQHILVIEEAHRLLKHIATERTSEMLGNPKGKAVETFCNIIAEMRSFGQGVIVAEQIPTKIASDVLKNTNTKIVHRLVSADDQSAMGASLGLPVEDCHYLNQLSTGFALVHKEGMARAVEVQIQKTLPDQHVVDELVRERLQDISDIEDGLEDLSKNELEAKLMLHESGLLDHPAVPVIARRLLNTVFLSKKELSDVLPAAVAEVRKSYQNDYVQNSTIEQALEQWFSRILLSPAMDMGAGQIVNEEVLEGIWRFWHEPWEFDRGRLVHRLDHWRGESSIECVCKKAATSVGLEMKSNGRDIKEILNCELLSNDDTALTSIREALRERTT